MWKKCLETLYSEAIVYHKGYNSEVFNIYDNAHQTKSFIEETSRESEELSADTIVLCIDVAKKFIIEANGMNNNLGPQYVDYSKIVLDVPDEKLTEAKAYCFIKYFQFCGLLNKSLSYQNLYLIYSRIGYKFNCHYINWLDFLYDTLKKNKDFVNAEGKLLEGSFRYASQGLFDSFRDKNNKQILKALCNEGLKERHRDMVIADINNIINRYPSNELKTLNFLIKEDKPKDNSRKSLAVSRVQLYFFFFFIIQNYSLPSLIGFWDDFWGSAGYKYEMSLIPNFESAITYGVLKNREAFSFQAWLDAQHEYSSRNVENKAWQFEQMEAKNIEKNDMVTKEIPIIYDDWKKHILQPGFDDEESSEKTSQSIQFIKSNLNDYGLEGLTVDVVERINDVDLRRRWYFNRLIYLILLRQQSDHMKRKLSAPNTQYFLTWIKDGNISIDRIAQSFNYCFDYTSNNTAFSRIEQRKEAGYNAEYNPLTANADSRSLSGTLRYLIRQDDIFGVSHGGEGNARKKQLGISREFLLLTALLCKAYGVDQENRPMIHGANQIMSDFADDSFLKYVKLHVLFNSRYSPEIDCFGNPFDEYFINAYKAMNNNNGFDNRITILKKYTGEFEKPYINDGIAILNRILHNKTYLITSHPEQDQE